MRTGLADRKTRAEIDQMTRQGRGRMPSYESMPEEKRNAILDYVLSKSVPADESSAVPKDTKQTVRDTKDTRPTYAFGGFRRWLDDEGYPAIKPPWGTLNAVDLNSGELLWKVVLGEYPELTARGIPPTGTENYGGPLVTAGGLIFIGATADETFRAFDKQTGELLWKASLPFKSKHLHGGWQAICGHCSRRWQKRSSLGRNSGCVCIVGIDSMLQARLGLVWQVVRVCASRMTWKGHQESSCRKKK